MKKYISLLIICTVLLCSCQREEYYPTISYPNEYKIVGDTISAELVNVYFFSPYKDFLCLDEGGYVILYSDDTLTEYLDSDSSVELCDGKNTFVLEIGAGDKYRLYNVEISCTMILDFEISVKKEKTYKKGEFFDKGTIEVTATKENGTKITAENYTAEYDFSSPGECRVYITYGDITHYITVTVE